MLEVEKNETYLRTCKLTVSLKVSTNFGGVVSSCVLSTSGDSDNLSSLGIAREGEGETSRGGGYTLFKGEIIDRWIGNKRKREREP